MPNGFQCARVTAIEDAFLEAYWPQFLETPNEFAPMDQFLTMLIERYEQHFYSGVTRPLDQRRATALVCHK